MKSLLLILASVMAFASTAYSETDHLVCLTGHHADMDIYIESNGDTKEYLSVVLTGMDGETIRTFTAKYKDNGLSADLADGKVVAVVKEEGKSKKFDGGISNAGMVQMTLNEKNNKYDVVLAVEGNVITGECAAQY